MSVFAVFTGLPFFWEEGGSCAGDVCGEAPGPGPRFQCPKAPLVSVVGRADPGEP